MIEVRYKCTGCDAYLRKDVALFAECCPGCGAMERGHLFGVPHHKERGEWVIVEPTSLWRRLFPKQEWRPLNGR